MANSSVYALVMKASKYYKVHQWYLKPHHFQDAQWMVAEVSM